MKKIFFTARLIILFISICLLPNLAYADGASEVDIKSQAYALYNTNNLNEALRLLNLLPSNQQDEETYVLIANIYEDKKDINRAIDNLNKALIKNPEYYKAYYNMGCILLDKKAYELAEKNLLLAVKYNKDFPYSYYNLGSLYIKTGKYNKAKKNLIKSIYLKGDEKDFYLNLAYVYKQLGKEKEARKLVEIYNEAK